MENTMTRAEALLEEAEKAARSGSPGAAQAFYEEAVRTEPQFGPAHIGLCSLLRRLGRPDEALARSEAFAAAFPKDAAAGHELGFSLLCAGRNADAVSAFGKALALQPGLSSAWKNMGIALGRMGRTEEAFRCFDRAEGRAPELSVPVTPRPSGPGFDIAMHDLMAGMQEAGGGCAHLFTDGPLSFKVAVAVLRGLLADYDMDGVVVSIARPAEVYRQALERRIHTAHPPYYIEVDAASADAAPDAATADHALISAFEPDRMAASVRAALQAVAGRYGGEEHFVLIDDLAAMEFYNGPEVVRRFVGDFIQELTGLNIFSFVIWPEAKASRMMGPVPFQARRTLRIKRAWFDPSGPPE